MSVIFLPTSLASAVLPLLPGHILAEVSLAKLFSKTGEG